MKSLASWLCFLVLGGPNLAMADFPVHAQNSSCTSIYQEQDSDFRAALGIEDEATVAYRVDLFLSNYAFSEQNFPSIQSYADRPQMAEFTGDINHAYDLLQKFYSRDDAKRFNWVMASFQSALDFAQDEKVADAKAITDYVQCLKDFMANAIAQMPDNPYYEYKMSALLAELGHPLQ